MRILVVKFSGLRGALATTAAFRSLKERHPGAAGKKLHEGGIERLAGAHEGVIAPRRGGPPPGVGQKRLERRQVAGP